MRESLDSGFASPAEKQIQTSGILDNGGSIIYIILLKIFFLFFVALILL